MSLPMQAGTIYRYFRADADHDVSGDPFYLSLDGSTWINSGVTYIPVGSLPTRPAAINTANPPLAGLTGYWWRVLTGPGTSFPLFIGANFVYGYATDNPETPHFEWTVNVGQFE